MKKVQILRVFRPSSSQIEQIEAILMVRPRPARTPRINPFKPGGSSISNPLFVDFQFDEMPSGTLRTFEEYCQQNDLTFWNDSHRLYSKSEIENTEFFLLKDEPVDSNTNSTQFTSENACPVCGVGLTQKGPLILRLIGSTQRRLFCVSLSQSREWIVSTELEKLFKEFSGFHFGTVCTSEKAKQPSEKLKQIIMDYRLPRMATLTAFSEYDPPMENKCSCSRAGWSLEGEKIYERSSLNGAKDFNLTVERWCGGGLAGLNWPVVSQKVRRVILHNKLLSPGCFEPIRIIEKDLGSKYQFDLPLDAPAGKLNSTRQPKHS